MAVKLSSTYQRILSTLAEMIEQDVLEMLRLLNEGSEEKSVVKIEKSFAVDERRKKIRALENILEENKRFFRDMGLKPARYTERQIFNAKISHLWTVLNDSRSGRLKGYGRQEKDAAEMLDDRIHRFLVLIQSLGQDTEEFT